MNDRQSAASNGVVDRRDFIRVAAGGMAIAGLSPIIARAARGHRSYHGQSPSWNRISRRPANFRTSRAASRFRTRLPDDKKREVGLTRETWKLEVISDPEHPAELGKPLTKSDGTAIDFAALMKLGEKSRRAIRQDHDLPESRLPARHGHLGRRSAARTGLDDRAARGPAACVLLRLSQRRSPADVPQLAADRPRARRSFDLPPVILCYKLNGQWLTSQRGGPVRIVVPEDYGFKSIKWLSHVVLTNLPHANDTYAEQGNDVDSPMKTFAATLSIRRTKSRRAGQFPITGYAQVGICGLSKVQVWITPSDNELADRRSVFHDGPLERR